jgi:hypothetical protein
MRNCGSGAHDRAIATRSSQGVQARDPFAADNLRQPRDLRPGAASDVEHAGRPPSQTLGEPLA